MTQSYNRHYLGCSFVTLYKVKIFFLSKKLKNYKFIIFYIKDFVVSLSVSTVVEREVLNETKIKEF